MTGMRKLLVHLNDEVMSRQAIEMAEALAGRLAARVSAVAILEPQLSGVGLSAETAALAQQIEHERRGALRATAEGLVRALSQQGTGATELGLADGDPVDVLQAASLTSDLLIVSQRDPAGAGGLSAGQAGRLLLGAACPVVVVPHIGWKHAHAAAGQPGVAQTILVAWAGTRESARALRDALPLLVGASQVELVAFAQGGQDAVQSQRDALQEVATYLGAHAVRAGVRVLNQSPPSLGERLRNGWVPDVAVAEALLSHAADTHADLIVMGGYGHSRLRQLVLGGVTRTMLESMTIPVLMSH
jgi:nucleotide-binding universal stress UspA family protein